MTNDLACRDVIELFTSFLDGTLDDATERQVREHLAVCEGCDVYLEQFRFTITEMRHTQADESTPVPRDVVEMLTTAFRATFPTI
jgi:anti-sigma factor RsiW